MGDYSTELCGGTHVDNSAEIHLFKIASEGGIAAGVRRMIAHTSKGAFEYLRSREKILRGVRDQLKAASVEEVQGRIERIFQNERDLKKQIDGFQAKAAAGEVDTILESAIPIAAGGKLLAAVCLPDNQGIKKLRDLADRLKQKAPDAVVVLGLEEPEAKKAALLIAVGPQGPKGVQANELLKQLAPLIDGKGGGKPDLAQAGGTKPQGLNDAIAQARRSLSAGV